MKSVESRAGTGFQRYFTIFSTAVFRIKDIAAELKLDATTVKTLVKQ